MRAIKVFFLCFFLHTSTYQTVCQTFTEVHSALGIEHTSPGEKQMNGGVVLFDANNDGFLDVFATGSWDSVHFYVNDQGNRFVDVTENSGLKVLYGVVTSGATSGDINNDGFMDLFVTTELESPNYLFQGNGDGTFTDISTASGIVSEEIAWSTSAVFTDVNLDGKLDLYVGNYREVFEDHIGYLRNFLYINQGDGTFIEMGQEYGLDSRHPTLAVTAFDHTGDFIPDLLEANDFEYPSRIYLNLLEDSARFVPVPDPYAVDLRGTFMGVAVDDYNHDLIQDVFLPEIFEGVMLEGFYTEEDCSIKQYNTLTLEDVSDISGNYVYWGCAFTDLNNDTFSDLVVSSGDIHSDDDPTPLFIFENRAGGTFVRKDHEYAVTETGKGRGLAVGDYDNDGDQDLFWAQTATSVVTIKPMLVFRNELENGHSWVQLELQGIESNPQGYGAVIYLYAGNNTYLKHVDGGSSYLSQNDTRTHFGLGDIDTIDSLKIIWPGGKTQMEYTVDVNALNTFTERTDEGHMVSDVKDWACYYVTPPAEVVLSSDLLQTGPPFDLSISSDRTLLTVYATKNIQYLELMDLSGKFIESESQIGQESCQIHLPNPISGLFVIRALIGEHTYVLKYFIPD